MSQYDPTNIFAKILKGDIPCHKIYETENCLAFMDVMPMSDGHCLVIPKAPSRNLLDADAAVLAKLMPIVQKIAVAAKTAMQADGVQIRQYNEAAAGQSVFHLHFHIIPIKTGEALRAHTGQMADGAVLKDHAEKIKAAL